MITGIKKIVVEISLKLTILKLSFSIYKSFFRSVKNAINLTKVRRSIYGDSRILKVVKAGNKFYFDLYAPGWPSKPFDRFIKSELLRIDPVPSKDKVILNTLIFAVTKKCPLRCEHCFEWDVLNKKETLSIERVEEIISDFVEAGVASVHISGGEPLLRLKELGPIILRYSHQSEFWLLTSGYHLNEEKAQLIKKSGFTGVIISLDHYDQNLHDIFRQTKESFQWVQDAVKHCKQCDLIVTLTICVTKKTANKNDINNYMQLARSWKVDFVQWLEPKAVGHYVNQDVKLSSDQEKVLDGLYLNYNYKLGNKTYPIVDYHGYHQRRLGCFSAGSRNIYVDTDGNIQACPFCKTKTVDGMIRSSAMDFEEIDCERYQKAK